MNTQNNGCPNPDGSCTYWDGPCDLCYPAYARKERMVKLLEDLKDPKFMDTFIDVALADGRLPRLVRDWLDYQVYTERSPYHD